MASPISSERVQKMKCICHLHSKLAESAAAAREQVVLGKKIYAKPSETKWTKMDQDGQSGFSQTRLALAFLWASLASLAT